MIATALAATALLVSLYAVFLAITAIAHAQAAHDGFEDMIDAANDMFQDHEDRISGLEFDMPIPLTNKEHRLVNLYGEVDHE